MHPDLVRWSQYFPALNCDQSLSLQLSSIIYDSQTVQTPINDDSSGEGSKDGEARASLEIPLPPASSPSCITSCTSSIIDDDPGVQQILEMNRRKGDNDVLSDTDYSFQVYSTKRSKSMKR